VAENSKITACLSRADLRLKMKQFSVSPYRNQVLLVGAVVSLLLLYTMLPSNPATNGHGNVRGPMLSVIPSRTEFLIVSDLDKRSLIPGLKKPRWKAVLKKVRRLRFHVLPLVLLLDATLQCSVRQALECQCHGFVFRVCDRVY
jgi:hypothetical protein